MAAISLNHFRFQLESKAPLRMPACTEGNVIRGEEEKGDRLHFRWSGFWRQTFTSLLSRTTRAPLAGWSENRAAFIRVRCRVGLAQSLHFTTEGQIKDFL
jgi:hypothetical protein